MKTHSLRMFLRACPFTFLGRILTVATLSLALSGIVAAGNEVPFKGRLEGEKQIPFHGWLQGQEIDVFQGPPPGTLAVDGSATGVATHLGKFTVTWILTVNLADGSATGSFHFIAANGDSIFTTISGQGEPTDTPGLSRIVEINTIVDGTGRFAGAKGSFTLERLVDLATGLTSGSFHGNITSPGAAR